MRPALSVIIINWNGLRWIERLLKSLRAQTRSDFEVLFVDNHSSDESVAFLREHFPEVRLVENERNAGYAGGAALGMRHSAADLVMLLNNDTWVEPDFVERMLARYTESGANVLAPKPASYEGAAAPHSSFVTTVDLLGYPAHLPARPDLTRFYLYGACLLFSRRLYEETGGLDTNFFLFFEETDWFWRMRLMGITSFVRAEDIVIHHRGGGTTGTGLHKTIFAWRNENNLQMLLKNYSGLSLVALLPVYFAMNVFEMLGCLLLLRPDLAATYPHGWWFNLRHLRRTLQSRAWVQARRKVRDRDIVRAMYFGSGKVRHGIVRISRVLGFKSPA